MKRTCNDEDISAFLAQFAKHPELFKDTSRWDLRWATAHPEEAISLFLRTLPAQTEPKINPGVPRKLTTRWTIDVGCHTPKELLDSLSREGFGVAHVAMDEFKRKGFRAPRTTRRVNLVPLNLKELGFPEKPVAEEFLTKEFCIDWSRNHLINQSITLCGSIDGAYLRRHIRKQPKGEYLHMAMKPFSNAGLPTIFTVENPEHWDGLWFHIESMEAEEERDLDEIWVFRLIDISPVAKN